MDEQAKADLEKLESLREQALCGPEEQREQAEQAYEELREALFDHQACQLPDDQKETKELTNVAPSTSIKPKGIRQVKMRSRRLIARLAVTHAQAMRQHEPGRRARAASFTE